LAGSPFEGYVDSHYGLLLLHLGQEPVVFVVILDPVVVRRTPVELLFVVAFRRLRANTEQAPPLSSRSAGVPDRRQVRVVTLRRMRGRALGALEHRSL